MIWEEKSAKRHDDRRRIVPAVCYALRKTGVALEDYVDFWLGPFIVSLAWFYYPLCQSGPVLCLWKLFLNIECPGCGLTRGICFLVHGRIVEAIRFNPLSIVALALLTLTFLKSSFHLYRAVTGRLLTTLRLGR